MMKKCHHLIQHGTLTWGFRAGERAPYDTTQAFIHDDVRIITEDAFCECRDLELCVIHDDVEEIGMDAFYGCEALRAIRLPRNLQRIGPGAFENCFALQYLFIPPGVTYIGDSAFEGDHDLRIMSFPPDIRMENESMGTGVMSGCDRFFDATRIQPYLYNENLHAMNSREINQSIIDFYRLVPPLHRICADTEVTVGRFHAAFNEYRGQDDSLLRTDHHGMAPLHILVMNPHAPPNCIVACFHLDIRAAFVLDDSRNTPLDYLSVNAHTLMGYFESVVSLTLALTMQNANNRAL